MELRSYHDFKITAWYKLGIVISNYTIFSKNVLFFMCNQYTWYNYKINLSGFLPSNIFQYIYKKTKILRKII